MESVTLRGDDFVETVVRVPVPKDKTYRKVEGTGDAVFHKGDPRRPDSDIDLWFNEVLGEIGPPKGRPYLYGSDAGLCARKNVFYERNTTVVEEKTPSSQGYMAIGVALENMLAEGLSRAGQLVLQDVRLIEMPQLKISGKIDLVVFDHEDELAIIEVKSCGQLPERPDPKHMAQVQMYCAVSGIHKAWLTYISRSVRAEYGPRLAIRTFPVPTGATELTHRLWVAAMSRLSGNKGKVPSVPREFRKTMECRYCPFLDFCWELEPRYRTEGSDGPHSPLQQLSISEQLSLEGKSSRLATTLYNNSKSRYIETVRALVKNVRVPKELRKKMSGLVKKAMSEDLEVIEF